MYIRNQCQLLHYAQSAKYVLLRFNAQCHLAAALALADLSGSVSHTVALRDSGGMMTYRP
jgi:hypothetical protein